MLTRPALWSGTDQVTVEIHSGYGLVAWQFRGPRLATRLLRLPFREGTCAPPGRTSPLSKWRGKNDQGRLKNNCRLERALAR
jgi:hypothetical protein